MKRISIGFSPGEKVDAAGNVRMRVLLPLVVCLFTTFSVTGAWGAIPPSERTVLIDIYTSTNGSGWTDSSGWNGSAGTECGWYGVTCDLPGDHVIAIQLNGNNLAGSLPDLSGLSDLQVFYATFNQLTGTIPPLAGLANLQEFGVGSNQLTGSTPPLAGLANLQSFDVSSNQLTGSIPSLIGLANLRTFYVSSNQLTGSIPSLAGLTNLVEFGAYDNQLTGSIPPLAGLANLQSFNVSSNQLAGSIPSLSGLSNLQWLDVSLNQLTGSIPSLGGLPNLWLFNVNSNQLTGSIPPLSGLANLRTFNVNSNQLTGSIPSLSSLANLRTFYVSSNQLTGTIPPLSGLASLRTFNVNSNQLTGSIPSLAGLSSLQVVVASLNQLGGDVPDVPTPNSLINGSSRLCPNSLNHAAVAAWDAATGVSPWFQECTTFIVTYDGNGSTGGSVPADGNIYTTGQRVTVQGNTGALYKTGYSFDVWNTAADGSGTWYAGGDTFTIAEAGVTLYAQWTPASGYPVRILETDTGYPDIKSAYNDAANGQTIQAQEGLGSQDPLFFDNPHGYNPFYVKLIGGYNATIPPFTTNTGVTLVQGGIEIGKGSVEIDKIIIQ